MSRPFSIVPDEIWNLHYGLRKKCGADGCTRDAVEGGDKCQIHTRPGKKRDYPSDWEPGKAYIYAIQCNKFVKIGQSVDVQKRLAGLQTSNPYPLSLLGAVKAPSDLEFAIHKYLESFRERLEWFRMTKRVMRVVNLIAEKKDVELAKLVGAFDGLYGEPADYNLECQLLRKTR